ncbi:MAG TPA: host-nuclease inhibitor Gam family protein [Verrucomicrobiae bacterium]|jgi:phage host-nuclease inhibitor protein Gam
MSKKRIKIKLPEIANREEAEAMMTSLAASVNAQRKIISERDGKILTVNKEYESSLAVLAEAVEAKTEALHVWAESSPTVFPKGVKSLKFISGILGFRTGTPKLALLSRAWNWDKVLAAIKGVRMPHNFVRTKEEVDKDALITYLKDNKDQSIALLGVKLVQEESFFIEPSLTDTDARQSTPAS